MALSKDYSRTNFTEPNPTWETVKIGSLQRIADATELMAKNYLSLQADRDLYKRWFEEERRDKNACRRRVSALRGVITKMKKMAA